VQRSRPSGLQLDAGLWCTAGSDIESAVSELSSWRDSCASTRRDRAEVRSEGRPKATRSRKPAQLCEVRSVAHPAATNSLDRSGESLYLTALIEPGRCSWVCPFYAALTARHRSEPSDLIRREGNRCDYEVVTAENLHGLTVVVQAQRFFLLVKREKVVGTQRRNEVEEAVEIFRRKRCERHLAMMVLTTHHGLFASMIRA
jgi:hypothetical protein